MTITTAGRTTRASIQSEIHRAEDDLLSAIPAATRRAFERTLHLVDRQQRDTNGR